LSRKEERGILRSSFCSEQPDVCLNAGALQDLDAAARLGIRIADRRNHPPHAGRSDRIRAGGVFP